MKPYLRFAKGLLTKLDSELRIHDVCPGTDMSEDVRYFLDRPRVTNELHAVGPFLLAGLEVLKLEKSKDASEFHVREGLPNVHAENRRGRGSTCCLSGGRYYGGRRLARDDAGLAARAIPES